MFGYPYRDETRVERWRRRAHYGSVLFLASAVGVAAAAFVLPRRRHDVVQVLRIDRPSTAAATQRTEVGAADTAMRAATLLSALSRQVGPERWITLGMVVPDRRQALLDRLGHCPRALARTPGCDRSVGFAAVSPVRMNVVKFTRDAAIVDVWTVAVNAADSAAPAAAAWSTQRITLVWAEWSGWLVADFVSRQGPVAAGVQPPTPAGELARPVRPTPAAEARGGSV